MVMDDLFKRSCTGNRLITLTGADGPAARDMYYAKAVV